MDLPIYGPAPVAEAIWTHIQDRVRQLIPGASFEKTMDYRFTRNPYFKRLFYLKSSDRIDKGASTYSYEVKTGDFSKAEMEKAGLGTKAGKAQDFLCLLSGSPIPRDYIRPEQKQRV
ncbi:hypothetical protein DPM13_15015 [Paracoccus mutanolyticus]|uniref:Uncharacterized protein n=1 Tax=Paracoccus mutanolyticus TaxID=1499308 RepID=A0ABM6WTX9_9RHOB|nr:hypothetical protein [Paracoccus mutanolyticus]AWX93883.1 hypothetical protein DPM13_15015 [Paracoccus mutanolyticus]